MERRPQPGTRPATARPASSAARRPSVRDLGAPSNGSPPRRDGGPGFIRWIGALVLLIALGVLVAILVLNQPQSTPGNGTANSALPATATPDTKLAIYDFGTDPIQTAQVKQFAKGTTVEKIVAFKLTGSEWQETAPQQFVADTSRITTAVTSMATLAGTTLVLDKGTPNPGGYGLDKPTVSIALTGKSGAAHTIIVGNQNPAKSGRYVSVPNDDRVWLVNNSGLEDMVKWPTDTMQAPPTPTPMPTPTPVIPGLPTKTGTTPDATTIGTGSPGTAAATTAPVATTAPAATTAPTTGVTPTPSG